MLRLLLIAPLALVALPAVAKDRAHAPHDVAAAIAKGCRVQQVHTPAGKMVHNATIISCPTGTDVAADQKDKKAAL